MYRYRDNVIWLMWLAPLRQLPVSAAYLTPFFISNGLNLTQIFLLQAFFSFLYLLLEVPSGKFADKYGRALSVKLCRPLAGMAMICYGCSDQLWQFVICEAMMAFAQSLISGADSALLYDSLKADGRHEKEFGRLSQRMLALGFGSQAIGFPLSLALVHYAGIQATIVADGVLALASTYFACRLVEAPRSNGGLAEKRKLARHAVHDLFRNAEARWLVCLATVLSTATYVAAWLSAPFYESVGLPLAAFSAVAAVRSVCKAAIAWHLPQERLLASSMWLYAALAGAGYLAMASGQWWLMFALLGHDAVHALHGAPITKRLNGFMTDDHRATLNSAASVVQRAAFMVAAPAAGAAVDLVGLSAGLAGIGAVCLAVAAVALLRLQSLGAFHERR